MNVFTEVYLKGLQELNIPYEFDDHEYLKFILGGKTISVYRAAISLNSDVAALINNSKFLSYKILTSAGITMPLSIRLKDSDILPDLTQFPGTKVVVKPELGYGGKAVEIIDKNKLEIYWNSIKDTAKTWILQEYISGKEYRVIIIGSELVSVFEKQDIFLTTNGITTLESQIHLLYSQSGLLQSVVKHILPKIFSYVETQGYALQEIPPRNTVIHLSRLRNESQGSLWKKIALDCIPNSHKTWLLSAHFASTLIVNGLDVMFEKGIDNLEAQKISLIECNARPGLTQPIDKDSGHEKKVILMLQKYVHSITDLEPRSK